MWWLDTFIVVFCFRAACAAQTRVDRRWSALPQRSESRRRQSEMIASRNPRQTRPRVTFSEQIRRRAYELYLERERECGGAMDDWREAEAQLLADPKEFWRGMRPAE